MSRVVALSVRCNRNVTENYSTGDTPMTPLYLTAVLTLLTTHPAAHVLMTVRVLLALHVAVPAAYLIYRMAGGAWDGIEFARRVLVAVHALRRAQALRRVGWAVGVVVVLIVSEL